MATTIYPCLWFDGKAKEAATFYCSVFSQRDGSPNGSKILQDTPMVVTFEVFGKKIMGLNGGPQFQINPSISFFILLETIDETNRVWDKLLEGGSVMMPIDKYFWSERYGWLKDKFGMTWQVSVVNNPGDAASLTPSMLFTGSQFGHAEEAVKLYTSLFENSSVSVMMHYPEGDANAGKVMFSEYKLDEYNLIAMDGPGEHAYSFNEGVSLVVECGTQEQIDHFWNSLTANGGQESMCGWLKDKFGISWQIVPSVLGNLISNPEKAPRVVQAFLKMKKFDIETLLKA